jgi:hypothetical protein
MNFLTRNILEFYKVNDKNSWYLTKFFTKTNNTGLYDPYEKNPIPSSWDNKKSFVPTIDEENTYVINEFGFRGLIDKDSETLASGCSMTFGIGVPELGRWTEILGSSLEKNVVNLGSPGASVETICTTLIQYCLNNKMPKQIFCLMPDFFRSIVVVDKEFYKSKTKRSHVGNKDNLEMIFCNPKMIRTKNAIFMEIEDAAYIEDATSPHQLILDSINFIYILESFCLTNNISLYWTTWDVKTSWIMEELKNLKDFKLQNFVSLFPPKSMEEFNSIVSKKCNIDHDSIFKDTFLWESGSDYSIIDYKKTKSKSHPGVHFQHHIADFFHSLYTQDAIKS